MILREFVSDHFLISDLQHSRLFDSSIATEKAMDQNRSKYQKIYCRVDIERIRESSWLLSGPSYSKAVVLPSQCYIQ